MPEPMKVASLLFGGAVDRPRAVARAKAPLLEALLGELLGAMTAEPPKPPEPFDAGPLLAEIEAVRGENARLREELAGLREGFKDLGVAVASIPAPPPTMAHEMVLEPTGPVEFSVDTDHEGRVRSIDAGAYRYTVRYDYKGDVEGLTETPLGRRKGN